MKADRLVRALDRMVPPPEPSARRKVVTVLAVIAAASSSVVMFPVLERTNLGMPVSAALTVSVAGFFVGLVWNRLMGQHRTWQLLSTLLLSVAFGIAMFMIFSQLA